MKTCFHRKIAIITQLIEDKNRKELNLRCGRQERSQSIFDLKLLAFPPQQRYVNIRQKPRLASKKNRRQTPIQGPGSAERLHGPVT